MFTEIRLAFYLYQARYKKVPGDDNLLPQRGYPWDEFSNNGKLAGNADGIIEYSTATHSESSLVWLHLRIAGLISGSMNDASPPRLISGVVLTVLTTSIQGTEKTYLCARNIDETTTQRITYIYNNRNRTLLDTDIFSKESTDQTSYFSNGNFIDRKETSTLCTEFL